MKVAFWYSQKQDYNYNPGLTIDDQPFTECRMFEDQDTLIEPWSFNFGDMYLVTIVENVDYLISKNVIEFSCPALKGRVKRNNQIIH